jgi:hypothetical protein
VVSIHSNEEKADIKAFSKKSLKIERTGSPVERGRGGL